MPGKHFCIFHDGNRATHWRWINDPVDHVPSLMGLCDMHNHILDTEGIDMYDPILPPNQQVRQSFRMHHNCQEEPCPICESRLAPHYHHMLSGGQYDPSQSSNLTGPSWGQYDLSKDTVEPVAPIYDPYGPNAPTAKVGKVVDLEGVLDEGVEVDACFGWIEGTLYLGQTHHAAILAYLVGQSGIYDWETIMSAKQAWGWYTLESYDYDQPSTENVEPEGNISFATDDAKQSYGVKAKVLASFKEAYPEVKNWYIGDPFSYGNKGTTQPDYGGRAREQYLQSESAEQTAVIQLNGSDNPIGTKWVFNNTDNRLYYWYTGDDRQPTHMAKIKRIKDEADWSIDDDNRFTFGSSNIIETPEQIIANPVRYETAQRLAGTTFDGFGYFDGKFYKADHHHADIIKRLVDQEGYTWDDLMNKPAVFGWLKHKTPDPTDPIPVRFSTGTSFAGTEGFQDDELRKEAIQVIQREYGRPAQMDQSLNLAGWADGAPGSQPGYEAYKYFKT